MIVSPGGSPRGLSFAGTQSDVQLGLAPLEPAELLAYRAKVLDAAAAHGRGPGGIRILFVVKPDIVPSEEEARRVVDASRHPTDAQLRAIALGWSSDLETDLTGLDLDRPVDRGVFGEHVSHGTIAGLYGGTEDAPLRELLTRKARKGLVSERAGFVGTAEAFADFVEELGDDADNDGLLLSGDLHPVTLHRMLDDLVPVLRRRGILRAELAPGGLRANLFD